MEPSEKILILKIINKLGWTYKIDLRYGLKKVIENRKYILK